MKFIENLTEADKIIRTADHMAYVTFPLVRDKRLLLKILSETQEAIAKCINAILQYEYIYKRIRLYNQAQENLNTFKNKCAKRYGITEQELEIILEIFELSEKHKKSPFEFMKQEKVVILSENMEQKTLTLEKTKQFIQVAKNLIEKTQKTIRHSI